MHKRNTLLLGSQGVKGLLEQAGYQVFNPTLPFHAPNVHWSFADGQMTVQKYVDTYIQVRTSSAMPAQLNAHWAALTGTMYSSEPQLIDCTVASMRVCQSRKVEWLLPAEATGSAWEAA